MVLRRKPKVRRGDRLEVGVSEPWDFTSDRGEGPFAATVTDLVEVADDGGGTEHQLVLTLDEPFVYKGLEWRTLLMTPRRGRADLRRVGDRRHEDGNLSPLVGHGGVFVIAYVRRAG